jgi:hypothetical protein
MTSYASRLCASCQSPATALVVAISVSRASMAGEAVWTVLSTWVDSSSTSDLRRFGALLTSGWPDFFGSPKVFEKAPRLFYKRECQEKILLPRAEVRRGLVSAFSPPSTRFCPVRCDVIVRGRLRPGMRVGCDPGRILLISAPGRSVVRADHREAEAAAGCLSLLGGSVLQYGPAFFQHFGARTAVSMHLATVGMGAAGCVHHRCRPCDTTRS